MGTGFDLPLTNEATIKACLDIYERRFVSKESQPEPIAHNIVAYRDVVVGQLSLIFTPRILPDLEAGRRHALLCKQATDILRSIGRELTDDASRCGFVCVLMGILEDLCDSNVEDLVPQKTKVIEEALQLLYHIGLSSRRRTLRCGRRLQTTSRSGPRSSRSPSAGSS